MDIKKLDGTVIYSGDAVSLRKLLELAVLSEADLSGADLSRADLSWADLSWANLSKANLSKANLSGANISRAIGIDADRCTPLRILLEQPGMIRAYKLVNVGGEGPFTGGIVYEIGQNYEVLGALTDETVDCGPGISLCTLDWALSEWREGYRILIAEFTREDIAAIPIGHSGKFRVFRCKIVGEKPYPAG